MAFQNERLKAAIAALPKYSSDDKRPIVSLEPVELFEAPWCRLVAQPARDKEKAAEALWNHLERDVDAFVYALVPRNLRQRVRSSGRFEEGFEAASAWVLDQIMDGFGVADTRASVWAGESERVVAIAFGTSSRPRLLPVAPAARVTPGAAPRILPTTPLSSAGCSSRATAAPSPMPLSKRNTSSSRRRCRSHPGGAPLCLRR